MNLNIYRNNQFITAVEIDKSTRYTHIKMGAHKVEAVFFTEAPVDIRIGDYITFEGENFYLNNIPRVKEVSSNKFEYSVVFEGERYTLYNKKLRHLSNAEFSYHGNAQAHLQLIIDNINEISERWSIGEVKETETKTIRYNSLYCREALNQIAEAFDLEFRFKGREITLVESIAIDTDYEFKYGFNKGLYSLVQRPVDSSNVITRWYGFGASKNIDKEYRNGVDRLVFEEKYIDVDVELYGVREGDYIDEGVFPQRTGLVTGIDEDKVTRITDADLEFDINDHLISGVTAMIVFKTGALAGSEFEINNYDHRTKEIVFNAVVDQFDNETPSEVRKPNIGDAYTLTGINMPESYVTNAEATLKEKTQAYANNNRLAVIYDLDIDYRYLRRKNILLNVGMKVRVQSDQLEVDELIEVNQISKPLIAPEEVKVVLSNTTVISESSKNLQIIKEAPRRLQEAERQSIDRDRQEIQRTRRHSVTKVFRGDFDAETLYVNTNNRSDVVKYQDIYWFYQGQNEVASAWNPKNWFPFEGNFESIATNTLLAEEASIADWTIQNGKITSQTEQDGIPNMILNGLDGVIKMSGISEEGFRQKSELRDEGSFLESGGMPLDEYTALNGQRIITPNSSVLKQNTQDVTSQPDLVQNILCAYFGKAINENTADPAPAYGGYFDELRADGLSLGVATNKLLSGFVIGENQSKVESLYLINDLQGLPVTVGFQRRFSGTSNNGGIVNLGKIVVVLNFNINVGEVNIDATHVVNSDNFTLQPHESAIFVYHALGWTRIGGLNESEVRRIANQVYTNRNSIN